MRIAVAGGTGTVGRHVVAAVVQAGHESKVLSRHGGVDVLTGTGLAEALAGIDVVIDVTNTWQTSRSDATDFFTRAAGNIQSAAAANDVQGIVTLSIVGIDRVPGYGYYDAKLAQERATLAGTVPATIVRSTQFHEFPSQIMRRTRKGPVAVLPLMKVQPIAARSVADVLVEVASDLPTGPMVQVAGPKPETVVGMARALFKARRQRVAVLPIPIPGGAGRAIRSGALLPGPDARLLGPTFAEWLVEVSSN